MTNESLERCICTGLAGFMFEDRPGGGRRVAIGCPRCGTRTENFTLDRIEDAVLAWEAGEFAATPLPIATDVWAAQGRPTSAAPIGGLVPSKQRS
jgi:hypothetical protein